MNTKMYGERTRPTDGASLCGTCRSARRTQGTRFGDDTVYCRAAEPEWRVTFLVTSCSSYDDNRLTPVWELEKTSWRYMPDLDRFVSPGEFANLEQRSYETDELAPAVIVTRSLLSRIRKWWAGAA